MEAETSVSKSGPSDAKRGRRYTSAVTSGRKLFVEGDGNSAWARRLRDLCSEHVADLGGIEAVSVAERSIVRRCATLTCELERLEGKFSTDGAASDGDLDLYSRVAGNLRRLLESLGLQRRPRDVTVDLQTFLAAHAASIAPAVAPDTSEPSERTSEAL